MIFRPLKKHLERKICLRWYRFKGRSTVFNACNPHCSRQCFFLQRSN